MQSSNIPAKIPLPFANAAGPSYKNTIPTASQIGITNGRASLTDGFPPLTFTALSAGGVPPFGADFNGILNEITAIQQWQNAGGFFAYDSVFSTAISGYPKGAVLQSADLNGFWLNNTENNTTNPDTGGAGWNSLIFKGSQSVTVTSSNVTLTQLQAAYPIIIVSGLKTAARNLIFPAVVGEWIIQNNSTGAFSLTAKTASGTGVLLTQGESTYIYGDGTNIYFSDSAKVASFNGRVGTVTLNATDVTTALGYVPLPTNNPISTGTLLAGTTTNPIGARVASATTGSGNVFGAIIGGGPGTGFLAQAASGATGFDFFGAYNSSLTRLFGVGSNGDVVGRGYTQTQGSSISGNGWTYTVNGMIIQWGSGTYNPGDFVSFPVTFPNNVFSLTMSDNNGRNNNGATSKSTSGFTTNLPSQTLLNYIVIGN